LAQAFKAMFWRVLIAAPCFHALADDA